MLRQESPGTDKDGRPFERALVKVAVIGFTPRGSWPGTSLARTGKMNVQGVVESAARYVPMARAAGADLVIAASSGAWTAAPSPAVGSAACHLAKVAGIDAILMGAPTANFQRRCNTAGCNASSVDKVKGRFSMTSGGDASCWGKAISVINLSLAVDGKWSVVKDKTQVRACARRCSTRPAGSYVAADAVVSAAVQAKHASPSVREDADRPVDYDVERLLPTWAMCRRSEIVNARPRPTTWRATWRAAWPPSPAYRNLPVLSVSTPQAALPAAQTHRCEGRPHRRDNAAEPLPATPTPCMRLR